MSIENTFERIATALEKLVELEMAASKAVLGEVAPEAPKLTVEKAEATGEQKPEEKNPEPEVFWNPKTEPTMLRYPKDKKDAVMAVAAELGVSTEGTTSEVHSRILSNLDSAANTPTEKPIEPEVVVEPEEVLDLMTVRKYVVAYVNNGRANQEGVALINSIAGVNKLVEVDPKFYAEIVRVAKEGIA